MRAIKSIVLRAGLYSQARYIDRHLLRRRELHRMVEMSRFFEAFVPQGALCFDIGANIGEVSEALLSGPRARVVAVEPQPECLLELRERCRGFANLTTLGAIVSAHPGVETLYMRTHEGQASLDPNWEGTEAGTLDVPAITLALIVARYGHPHYLKIDVEGAEAAVLSTLDRPLPWISFEYHRQAHERARTCLQILDQLGGDQEVNLTVAEQVIFQFDQWIPLKEFIARLEEVLPRDGYGDMYVRTRLDLR